MSVLIKGMDELPDDGAVLVVMHDNGKVYIKDACTYGYHMEMVKLPEKHGRLIDADALMEDIRKHCESYFAVDFAHEWVDKQPTVIEAEGDLNVSCYNQHHFRNP